MSKIKVGYDIKPITAEDRDKWEAMQSAAYQQGFMGSDHSKDPGIDFMRQHGIDPSMLPSYQQDFLNQEGTPHVRAGEDGFSTVDDIYGHKTSRQRYVKFAVEHIDRHGNIVPEDSKEYGANFEQFASDEAKRKQALDAEYAGMGDPKNNINYQPPVEEVAPKPVPVPNPDFPTYDDKTHRFVPSLNQRLRAAAAAEQAANEEAEQAERKDRRRNRRRNILNGIFGNDTEGNAIAHAY